MIHKFKEVKEVKITNRKNVDYYTLFTYNPNKDEDRYYLLFCSHDLDFIEKYKIGWSLGEGEEFRIFKLTLPNK